MNRFQTPQEMIEYFQELLGDPGVNITGSKWKYDLDCRYFNDSSHRTPGYYVFPRPCPYQEISDHGSIVAWYWDISLSDRVLCVSMMTPTGFYPVRTWKLDQDMILLFLMMPDVRLVHKLSSGSRSCKCGSVPELKS